MRVSFFWLILGLLLAPLLEIYVFIKVGERVGAMTTVLFTLFTAVSGVVLVRLQGLVTWYRAQQSLAQGVMPAESMLEGLFLLLAGILLLIPGFITDFVGMLWLLPILRRKMVRLLLSHVWIKYAGTTARGGHRTLEGQWREDKDGPDDRG